MHMHRIEAVVQEDGKLIIEDIPFHEGDRVEVTIQTASQPRSGDRYPLRGTVIKYIDPTDPVASNEWEANS